MKAKFELEVDVPEEFLRDGGNILGGWIVGNFKLGMRRVYGEKYENQINAEISQIIENEPITAVKPLVLQGLDWSNRNDEKDTEQEKDEDGVYIRNQYS